jgi:hypothetical protein
MAGVGGRLLKLGAAALFCAAFSVSVIAHEAPRREPGKSQQDSGKKLGKDANEHGVETENLFGFTHGSDTGEAGSAGVSTEGLLALGKRIGSFRALGTKLELGVGATDDFSLSMSALGACHRIRNVPELDDVGGRCGISGVGTEFRWRLLNRRSAPFGLTLHTEPAFTRLDETSGKPGRGLRAENKIIIDRELLPDTLFGAVNLIYGLGKFRERFALETERGSVGGVSGALAVRLSKITFLGGEVQYLRAYDGLGLDRFSGQAIYAGPSLYAQLTEKLWVSAVWNAQLSGREAIDRREVAAAVVAALDAGEDPLAAVPVRQLHLDLRNFTRHLIRVKAGFDF